MSLDKASEDAILNNHVETGFKSNRDYHDDQLKLVGEVSDRLRQKEPRDEENRTPPN